MEYLIWLAMFLAGYSLGWWIMAVRLRTLGLRCEQLSVEIHECKAYALGLESKYTELIDRNTKGRFTKT